MIEFFVLAVNTQVSGVTIVSAVSLVFPAAMVYAGWRDVVSYEVPNWVSVVLVVAFVFLALVAGTGVATLAWHLAAGAAVLAIGSMLFAMGSIGGADVKLLAAAAVWSGWSLLADLLVVMALVGGVLAVGLLVWRRFKLPDDWARHESLRRLHDRDRGLPYCAAIGCAALWIYPGLPLFAVVRGSAGV